MNKKIKAADLPTFDPAEHLKDDAEIAAYHVDKILGFNRVPPTVGRLFDITKDLWEKAMNAKRGFKTVEDLYWWCKKQVKEVTTKSEMDIQLKRANTKGLQRLF
jgi:hypothetical protein